MYRLLFLLLLLYYPIVRCMDNSTVCDLRLHKCNGDAAKEFDLKGPCEVEMPFSREIVFSIPSPHSIKKKLSQDENYNNLLKVTHLHTKIGGKSCTMHELTQEVYQAVNQWAHHHQNAMILMLAQPTVDSIINNLLTITPKKM